MKTKAGTGSEYWFQWGCASKSKVRVTKHGKSSFRYFPSFSDKDLTALSTFRFPFFKKISPRISLQGKQVNLLDILSLPSLSGGPQSTPLGLNFRNTENRTISSLVHELFAREYDNANPSMKLQVLADARTAQSKVDNIYSKRLVILEKMFSLYMQAIKEPVVMTVSRDSSAARRMETEISVSFELKNVNTPAGSSRYTGLQSTSSRNQTFAINLNRVSDLDARTLRQGIQNTWGASYKSSLGSDPASQCYFSVTPSGRALKSADFLLAASYKAMMRNDGILGQKFLTQNPNAAKINSEEINTPKASYDSAKGKTLTLGLFNNLEYVLGKRSREMGTGRLVGSVLNSEIQSSDITKICSFLNNSSSMGLLTATGLKSRSTEGYCASAPINQFLYALLLVDFMLIKEARTMNQFDVHMFTYLTNWLPKRAKAVAGSSKVAARGSAPGMFSVVNIPGVGVSRDMLRPHLMYRPTLPPQTDQGDEGYFEAFIPSDQQDEGAFTDQGDEGAFTDQGDEGAFTDQGDEGYFEVFIPSDQQDEGAFIDDELPVSVDTTGDDAGGSTELTEGDGEKKTSYTPYIFGVLIAGAVGAYLYVNRDK